MLARGLGANITGSRADIIICDDVEVPKTCDSAPKRVELREKLSELDYVLVPDGMMLYVGTPHSFLTGFNKLKLPILDKNGNSQWPSRFSKEKIKSIQKRTGNNKFLSQMMLTPVNIAEGRLNVDAIKSYDAKIDFNYANGESELKISGVKMVSASCWWDPSFATNSSDSSVIACVFTDEAGEYWLHDILYIRVEESQKEKSASVQCKQVIEFIKENHLSSIRIEKNGIGRFLPELLRQELSKTTVSCAILEENSSKSKELRIIEAFDAILANGALHAHKNVWKTPFISEMREWIPNGKCKDDGIDAVAGCLSATPIRLPKFSNIKTSKNWSAGSKTYNAQNSFNVF
jgi:hypothetical protein